MVLYIDILFIINFSMDFLSLFLSSVLLHKKIYRIRIIAASLIGAAYAIFQQLVILNPVLSVLSLVFISIIMCVVSFKESSYKQYLVLSISFFFISAAIGGIMSALYSFFNRVLAEYIMKNSSYVAYKNARWVIVIGLTVIFAVILTRIFNDKRNVKSVETEIVINNTSYKMTSLCDSGNSLREPFSGKSVILVSKNCKLGALIDEMDEIKKRLIPYEDINGRGIIKGIIPEKILINGKGVAAVVATVNNRDFNGYSALIPGNLM